MINASKEFKEKLKKGGNVVDYADVTLSNGTVLHLEPKDFMLENGCAIEDKTTDGKFGVGFSVGKTLTLRIANHDERFSQYDFYKSFIYLYVALALDNGRVEKIRKGVYYTLVPQTPGDIIEISAVDGMYKLDRDYADSATAYPATLRTILSDACNDCGIPVGFREFDNMDFVVEEKPDKGTYRQIVSYACQIAGYNARIDNDGYMQLVWYDAELLERYVYNGGDFHTYPHDTVVYGGNFTNYRATTILSGGSFTDKMPEHIFSFKDITIHTDDVQITGVKVIGDDENAAIFGEEGYLIEVSENPFAAGKEAQVAEYLGRRMVGMAFRPFSAQALNNPLYEPFDIVRVSDRKGNVYISILNSVSYAIGQYTQVACEAEDPVRNGSSYFSPAAAAVVEARKNAKKQITEYDQAVQNMNQLAMNAMGYYTTYEDGPDGSRITYLHDKAALEDSKFVYKQSIDGFFISQDGGKSYTAGRDKYGNAVLNVIHAMTIYANQITAGRFEVKKGNKTTFLADVDTGEVRIVADSFSLTSGKTIEGIAQEAASDKNKVFTSTPTPPYNVGDLWMMSDKSGVKVCANARASGAFVSTDWVKRDNYIDASQAETAANSAAKKAINAQTQTDILNRLTNNGQDKGVYLQDGKLYISFNAARGGELTLGGANNGSGSMIVLDEKNQQIGKWHKDGFQTKGKMFAVSEDGAAYSNNPRFAGSLYMAGTVSDKLNTTEIERTKAKVMGLAYQNASSQTHGGYTLYIGNVGGDSSSQVWAVSKISLRDDTVIEGKLRVMRLPVRTSGKPLTGATGNDIGILESSSRRYKDILRHMRFGEGSLIYELTPTWAKFKPGYLDEMDERNNVYYPMLIAEDVEKHIPLAANHNPDGSVEDWNQRVLIPYMIQALKEQKKEIDELKSMISNQ